MRHHVYLSIPIVLALACGKPDPGTQPAFIAECCLGTGSYTCLTRAAYDKCIGFDHRACDAACDPTDGDCNDGCCYESTPGNPCTFDSDCASGGCVDQLCQ